VTAVTVVICMWTGCTRWVKNVSLKLLSIYSPVMFEKLYFTRYSSDAVKMWWDI